jgi:alkylhydroperoxidase family enzyme
VNAVLCTPGATSESLRRAVLERALETPGATVQMQPALSHYVDTIDRHAYRVTDADVRALQAAGHSDDALFEITIAGAVGAAMHRLQRGMAALRGEELD